MTALVWDANGERRYETGVDHGVLYIPDEIGEYSNGYAWNGLTAVTESPSGAEANPQYADNMKYLNLISVEEFAGTIEAFTYPDEFGQCDGTAEPEPGIQIGQQSRRQFGFSYRTKVGNDQNPDLGYKLHLVYNALAAPSEKPYNTVNDSPEAITFSWEFSTTPVPVTDHQPTASITIDSTKVSPEALATLEDILYGTIGEDPMLPTPDEVIALFAGSLTEATPLAPTFSGETSTITIPVVTGVVYRVGSTIVTGAVPITVNTLVKAKPASGYKFPVGVDTDWFFEATDELDLVTPEVPTMVPESNSISVPDQTGVIYRKNGVGSDVSDSSVPITEDTIIVAFPAAGYVFPDVVVDAWLFEFFEA